MTPHALPPMEQSARFQRTLAPGDHTAGGGERAPVVYVVIEGVSNSARHADGETTRKDWSGMRIHAASMWAASGVRPSAQVTLLWRS